MTEKDLEPLMTRAELMARWKCSRWTLSRLARDLHPIRPGKYLLYPELAVLAYERELQKSNEPRAKDRRLNAMREQIRFEARGW